tara:strand:- start:2531 stop:3361 length:831 start_codon:yes stop_codon:yes gene_type:complete
MSSYTHKILNYNKGIFDKVVDVTYIITMDDSFERHKNIFNELEKHHPTKEVIIIYNKGFKNIKKSDNCGEIDISYKDLTYTIMYIFSISENKNNILILEDDYIFNSKIRSTDIDSITNFFMKKKPNIYSLGSVNILSSPLPFCHKRLYIKGGTHAMIYSKIGRSILQKQFETCKDITQDIDTLTCFQSKTYGYYKNIYAQTFSRTDNRDNWGKHISYMSTSTIVRCMIIIINIFEMDMKENIHNKFDNLNSCFLMLHRSLILFVIYVFAKFAVFNV